MYAFRFLNGNNVVASGQLASNPDLEKFFQNSEVFDLPENATADPKVFRVAHVQVCVWKERGIDELILSLDALGNDWFYGNADTLLVEAPSMAKGLRQILSILGNRERMQGWETLEITRE